MTEEDKKIETLYTGKIDDRLNVIDKYKEDYEEIHEREKLFKRIIYLNGVTYVTGVQGTGKTYLIKSILQNPKVKEELNNCFWIDNPNDIVFLAKWFFYKKTCFEGLNLLFENKLKGEYFERWDVLTEKTHMTVNDERFDFLPFDPVKYDMIVIDDVGRFGDLRMILQYCTILRHIHCGVIFIGQTEGILPKPFRDLCAIYITFNLPDTKMITNAMTRRTVGMLIKDKRSNREAVMIDFIENKICIITADDVGNKHKEEEDKKEAKNKKETEITDFAKDLEKVDV